MPNFNGFPKGIIDFYTSLESNNNKEWFDAHKQDYEKNVKKPSIEFVEFMGAKLKTIAPNVKAEPKVNKSLFRINRDTRFSPDKTPYKNYVGLLFWEGQRKGMDCSSFYFHFDKSELMIGAGIKGFSKTRLNRYRDAVANPEQGAKLLKAVASMDTKIYNIQGKHYKKIPNGYSGDLPASEFLLYNGLTVGTTTSIDKTFFSPKIIDIAFEHYKNMLTIQQWLNKYLYD